MNFQVAGLARTGTGIALDASDGKRLNGFDCVIWAVGRAPNTGELGLDKAGVDLRANGIVPYTDAMRLVMKKVRENAVSYPQAVDKIELSSTAE